MATIVNWRHLLQTRTDALTTKEDLINLPWKILLQLLIPLQTTFWTYKRPFKTLPCHYFIPPFPPLAFALIPGAAAS
jgi:hypothetical protein